MRKTLVFRLVALKVLVISAVSLGCGGEVANANYDPHDPFNPTSASDLLYRVESYARLLRSWQLGSEAYTQRAEPMRVYRLSFEPFRFVDAPITIANRSADDAPFRVTDALESLAEELHLIRQAQRDRVGDTLDAFSGGDSVDRLMGDEAFLHRFVQGLLAIRELQRQILVIEQAGAAALPGSTKKMNVLTSPEIDLVRQEVGARSRVNGPTFQFLDRAQARPELPPLMNPLSSASYHRNGAPLGFQRILLRYQVLTKTLGIADVSNLESLLYRIEAVREHASPIVPDLPFSWDDIPPAI